MGTRHDLVVFADEGLRDGIDDISRRGRELEGAKRVRDGGREQRMQIPGRVICHMPVVNAPEVPLLRPGAKADAKVEIVFLRVCVSLDIS